MSTTKRVLTYTALFAGGSILLCPPVAAAVGVGAATTLVATSAVSLFGNTLANDLHAAFTTGRLDPLANHHLQELVGRSLSVLIEFHEKQLDPPTKLQAWLPFLRRPDAELSALARAAREHWNTITLTGESASLDDSQIHKAFTEHDRTSPTPLVSADEWDRHLTELSLRAETRFGQPADLIDHVARRRLAEFIAPRFALAVRELVKSDLDPAHGTGGRVFIGLHLDLMRSLSVSLRGLDGKADAALAEIQSTQRQLDGLSRLVVDTLSREQKQLAVDLILVVRDEHEVTRRRLDELQRLADAHEQASAARHTEAMAGSQRLMAMVQALLDRDKRQQSSFAAAAGELPAPLPVADRSPEERELLARARASGDRLTRIRAAIADRDFTAVDTLLTPETLRDESQATFNLLTAQGDRWFFAGAFDRAVVPYETALLLRPDEFLARNNVLLARLSARLGDVAAHRRRAIELATETLGLLSPDSVEWATTQNNLGEAWRTLPTGDQAHNVRRAIDAYTAAQSVFTPTTYLRQWVMTQNNLAIAWADLPTGDQTDNLRRAIDAFAPILVNRVRKADPIHWAMAQNNVGEAWRRMPTGDRADNLRRAIDAYSAAMTVYTRDDHPDAWAQAQNNLGIAWADVPGGDQADHLRRAIAAFDAALTVRTRETHPADWAATQINLGEAWRKFPVGDPSDNLRNAIDAYSAALTVLTRENHPILWAAAQNNLGIAWNHLPTGDRAANLRRAIDACHAALIVRTRDAHPADWAATQINLGEAWRNLPGGDRADNLRRAIDACAAAMTVFTPDTNPQLWATAQNNLGAALLALPTGDRAANLARAAAALTAALTVRTREAHPVDWAASRNNLALTWLNLPAGDRAANLRRAIDDFTAVQAVFTRDAQPLHWALTQTNLMLAWVNLPDGDRADHLRHAITAANASLTVYTRAATPIPWAQAHHDLAALFAELAEQPGEARCPLLQQAIAHGKAALVVRTPEHFPNEHAETSRNLRIDRETYESAGCGLGFDGIPPAIETKPDA